MFQRDDRTLVRVNGFDHKVSTDSRTFYFVGTIDGLVQSDYTVEKNIAVPELVGDLCSYLPAISGRYAGFSVRDGALEFAASDIGAVEELYYTMTETELIISTDFFALAKAKGLLNYDVSEVRFFFAEGFCHKGKTTFNEVYRLPPGEALELDANGTILAHNYLGGFKGTPITFDVFKSAIDHSIRSIIQSDPFFEEAVLFSGGLDSSVLLSLIKDTADVKAATYRFIPALSNWNESDVQRSERVAEKLQVPREVVDVDLNEIHLGYLEDMIVSMPFAAHLGVNFLKLFEALRSPNKRLWSGQNMDTLYNYTATSAMSTEPVRRFLLSDGYVRMLNGVKGYKRYRPIKKVIDLLLRWLYRATHEESIETPYTVEELIEYFCGSRAHLALRVAGELDDDQIRNVEASEDIEVNEIRGRLFDAELGCFFTGPDHKVQLQAAKLCNVRLALAYSAPNIVHLLRGLHLSWLDVLLAKRYLYRYARELGIYRSDFQVEKPRWRSKNVSQDWVQTFESTSFGTELRQKTNDLAMQIGLVLSGKDEDRWQKELGILWINNVRQKLSHVGVEMPRWPIC